MTQYKCCGLERIISSGELGADSAALVASKTLGLKTAGWCQSLPSGKNQYNLKAIPPLSKPHSETKPQTETIKRNVNDSDGTVIFRVYTSIFTDLALGYCISGKWRPFTEEDKKQRKTLHKPCLVISDLSEKKEGSNIEAIRDFIIKNRIKTLNVTGHRDGSIPGYTNSILSLLVNALSQ